MSNDRAVRYCRLAFAEEDIRGTHVPVEEPSTASRTDICFARLTLF